MPARLTQTLPGYRAFVARFAEVKIGFDLLARFEIKLIPPALGRDDELSDEGFVAALVRIFEELQQWRFEGVCFLLDEAEYIISRGWAEEAWPYLRALKDSEAAVKSLLGIVLSGYRDLKEYRQRVGSPLNIAEVEWLTPLMPTESHLLAQRRSQRERMIVDNVDLAHVQEWAGSHPFLTQQILNALFDGRATTPTITTVNVAGSVGRQLRDHFSDWWNHDGRSDGIGDDERRVYRALAQHRRTTSGTLARASTLPEGRVIDALDVLVGTGIVLRIDDDVVAIGARLFERWVSLHHPK
jgi:hypothetical protein